MANENPYAYLVIVNAYQTSLLIPRPYLAGGPLLRMAYVRVLFKKFSCAKFLPRYNFILTLRTWSLQDVRSL
jgi:hypothetical protein